MPSAASATLAATTLLAAAAALGLRLLALLLGLWA
jgi:hypothetical protein